MTSPPYWGLRKYAGEQNLVWGGDKDCTHNWTEQAFKSNDNNPSTSSTLVGGGRHRPGTKYDFENTGSSTVGTCSLCGAWRGAFGLEPSLAMYIQHTVEILREIRRVLRKDGAVFWNVGDSYAGGGNYRGLNSSNTLTNHKNEKDERDDYLQLAEKRVFEPSKLIPQQAADGWGF